MLSAQFGSPDFSVIVERLNYGCLYIRTHINYPSTAVSKFFPITIEEINEGWIKGKERIITNRNGKFGWAGEFSARIWQYDKKGKLMAENPEFRTFKQFADITVPAGGLCIIERGK